MIIIYTIVAVCGLVLLHGPLCRAIDPDRRHRWVVYLIHAALVIVFAFPVLGALVPQGPVCYFFQKWGNLFIGYILYFFVPFLLLRLIMVVPRLRQRRQSRRRTFASRFDRGPWNPPRAVTVLALCVLLVGTIAINLLGTRTAHDVQVTYHEMAKEDLGQKEPLRIVLISDLHIGVNSNTQLYKDMVDRVNEQSPDLVLVGGDIVTSAYEAMEDPSEYARILSGIHATYGCYVVYGNHDVDEPLLGGFPFEKADKTTRHPDMANFLADCGWQLLTDQVVQPEGLEGLSLVGRRDESRPGDGVKERASLEELLKEVPKGDAVLLLEHEPVELSEMDGLGVDLVVAGHTHAGQIFPGNVWGKIHDDQYYGFKKWGKCSVAVTSGVGFYGPPIRVGTISEVMVIDAK